MTRFHGEEAAAEAEAAFDRVFVSRELPEEIEEATIEAADGDVHLPELIATVFGGSRSEARRHLASGAVKLDGEPVAPDVLDVPRDGSGRPRAAGRQAPVPAPPRRLRRAGRARAISSAPPQRTGVSRRV